VSKCNKKDRAGGKHATSSGCCGLSMTKHATAPTRATGLLGGSCHRVFVICGVFTKTTRVFVIPGSLQKQHFRFCEILAHKERHFTKTKTKISFCFRFCRTVRNGLTADNPLDDTDQAVVDKIHDNQYLFTY
jgi:hypothetical protein